jgi:hypothetical protein
MRDVAKSEGVAIRSEPLASTEQLSRTAIWLACLYALILVPILRADRLYNDDLKRALFGRTGWDSNGRPLTTLLMKVLQCYDHALVDISPFTQLVAGALLVWTGLLVARRFCRASPFLAGLIVFPLGAQPFFLENLSYKFDALSMALALLTALLPFALPGYNRRRWWWGVLSLFACLNFYQPALNAFLVFLLLEAAIGAVDVQPIDAIVKPIRFRLGQLFASGLTYELPVGIHVNGWVKRKSAPIHTPSQLPLLGETFFRFLRYIGNSFNHQWWAYFGPLLFILGLVSSYVVIRYALRLRDTHPAWLIAATVAIGCVLPVVALVAALGPLLLLADPPIAPRVLIGIGPLLCAALILFDTAIRSSRLSSHWALVAGVMLAAGCSILASVYGNATTQQKAFEENIARTLANDVANVSAQHRLQGILLDGSAGYARLTAHAAEQFPIIRSLVPIYLDAADPFHPHIFLIAYLPDFVDLRLKATPETALRNVQLLDAVCHDAPVTIKSAYRLCVRDDVAIVLFGSAYATRYHDPSEPVSQSSGTEVLIARH